MILILIPLSQWSTILKSPSQSDLDDEIKMMSLKKSITNIDMKNFLKDCQFCKKPKFIRSSHCTTCGICVLRRDHHCPWVGSCIGYQNTRTFINWVFWSGVIIN